MRGRVFGLWVLVLFWVFRWEKMKVKGAMLFRAMSVGGLHYFVERWSSRVRNVTQFCVQTEIEEYLSYNQN